MEWTQVSVPRLVVLFHCDSVGFRSCCSCAHLSLAQVQIRPDAGPLRVRHQVRQGGLESSMWSNTAVANDVPEHPRGRLRHAQRLEVAARLCVGATGVFVSAAAGAAAAALGPAPSELCRRTKDCMKSRATDSRL